MEGTTGRQANHLVSTIGTDLSPETISKITDQTAEEILAWQQRPLESLYPVGAKGLRSQQRKAEGRLVEGRWDK